MIINRKLNCGVEVIMDNIPYVQSTCIGIWVKTGSVNENETNYGISHFIEHMLFKGTETRTAKQIAEDIDKIGGQINAFTGKESTCFYVKTLDSNIEKASEVLFDLFFHSTFDEGEMEKEKSVVYEEINMHEDSPEEDIHDLFFNAIFNNNPLGTPILGTKKILEGMSREDLLKYVDDNYTVGNVIISVTGNFNEEHILSVFEDYFKDLSKKSQKKVIYPVHYTPEFIFKEKEIEQAHLCMGLKGITIDDDMHYAFALVNNVLGGSMSSRLFQSIREEKGMAYSVYSYLGAYTMDGAFAIYAGVGQNQLPQTIELILQELTLLKNKGITKEEFNSAKEQLKGNYIFSLESVSGRMVAIGKSQLLLNKVYTPKETINSIDAVTMEEVEKVIEIIHDIKNYSAAGLGKKAIDLKAYMNN